MNETIWAVFSEWDEINSEVKAFCEQWAICEQWDEINSEVKAFCEQRAVCEQWEAFMSCVCVKERKECLRLDERGLKGMSSELKES